MNQRVADFRQDYRRHEIDDGYSGRAHLWLITIASGAGLALCIDQLDALQPLEWLAIPVTFIYMNFAEYFGHRGPMHHRKGRLEMIYKRHTLQHHRFFTADDMAFDETRDYKAVLFPPVLITFFLLAFALPYWFLVSVLFTTNVAWLSLGTLLAYYLQYEWLHFTWHLRDDALIYRVPGMRIWRQLHLLHHDHRLMNRGNFNITVPLADLVMGTLILERPDEAQAGH